MTPTDNKAPRELPEPEPTSSLEYKMLWHSHKELQLRIEKCEGLLAESKGYLLGYTDAGKPLALEIDKYFAEVEK